MEVLGIVIAAALLGIAFCVYNALNILKAPAGDKKMQEISNFIREGAMAYLKRQYKILAIFVIVVAAILFYFISFPTAVSFVIGALCSALAGFLGMNIATLANVRTTNAAKKGMKEALNISFSSGLVMAMFASCIALLAIVSLMTLFRHCDLGFTVAEIFGFSFGASSVALFARVGGGIYTKAADVGADLVGKVEKHIPEDDPRNPAVIADNVGDNVGDVAGMGADLFESYVGAIISSMAIGWAAFDINGINFPLLLAAIGVIASIIAAFFVKNSKEPHSGFIKGLIYSSIIVAIVSFAVLPMFFSEWLNIFIVVLTGLVVGILIGWNTDRYTSEKEKYAKQIAEASKSGVATTILKGFVVGMRSTRNTLLILAVGIFLAYYFGNLYGIALAGVAMLSTLGISLAIDAFGPVVDNAGGIAEMSSQPKEVRKITDALDAAGNTTAAMGKGFAIGSAALTAMALFAVYTMKADLAAINVANANVLIGVLIGAMLPFYFSSLTINAVERAAFAMVEEVRRQFREIKGLLQGKAKPDYARCVEISTNNALKAMIAPGLLAIIAPILIGFLIGKEALGGLLVGSLATGVCLAVMLSNSGGAWDNAKKLLEQNKEDSEEWHKRHDATVIADTVGDPFKDTSGPSLNILIKLMSIVALIFAPLIGAGLI